MNRVILHWLIEIAKFGTEISIWAAVRWTFFPGTFFLNHDFVNDEFVNDETSLIDAYYVK